MGALHDYIAVDPVTERSAVVNFPVCKDNIYKIDVEETKKVIQQYKPELIIFGKSMVLHKEPVAAIRQFVDEQNIPTTIMYDMAHVLGLIGDHFQKPLRRARRSSPAPPTRPSSVLREASSVSTTTRAT